MVVAVISIAALVAIYLSQRQPSLTQDNTLGDYLNEPVWSFYTDDPITSTPSQDGHNIYLRTSSSVLALDALSGKQIWRVDSPAEAPLSMLPYIVDEYLVVSEKGSGIVVINKESGTVIWKSAEIDIIPTHSANAEIQSIMSSNNILYVARFSWYLTAYNLQTGKVVWKQNIPSHTSLYLASNIDTVFLGAGNQLIAYDSQTGLTSWTTDINGYIGPVLLDVDQNTLFVTNENAPSLIAINLINKQILWEKYLDSIDSYEFGCLIKHGDVLYIAAEELLALSSIDGEIVWQTSKTGRLECPIVMNNQLFVRNTNTSLYGFDLDSGKELGRLTIQTNTPMKHEPNRGPIASGNLIIIPITDNKLNAYYLD
jgi:outer membrane protein assembly factor BamB